MRFELFFALQLVVDREARLHAAWLSSVRAALPPSFAVAIEALGGSPHLFPLLADVTLGEPKTTTFEQLRAALVAVPEAALQARVLAGALHDRALARRVSGGELELSQAVARVKKAKREWLGFLGLYPARTEAPLARGLTLLIRSPRTFRKHALAAIDTFHRHAFADTWSRLRPELQRSIDEKERLFATCSFGEFARTALLRVEVDDKRHELRAIRGGYRLALDDVRAIEISPSAFNEQRLWTVDESSRGACVFLPCFDPKIALDDATANSRASERLDPALIFRALGDATRWAIAQLLSQSPRTSADLARLLSVSRPTISHHVYELRQAGLLDEEYAGGSVVLSLRRAAIESLSSITVRKLFEPAAPVRAGRLKKTRSKP